LRPELTEDFEAIVLRAMHLSPKDRFESIHALGQRLWKFASSRGQEQWKTFYFHTPAAAQPAKAALNEPGRLRELAREKLGAAPTGAAPAPAPVPEPAKETKPPRADSTASLEPASALAKTEPLRPVRVEPEQQAITKTAPAAGIGEPTSLSHSDIAGESALSEARDAGRGARSRRWRVAVGAAAAICVAVIALQRPWRGGSDPASPVRSSVLAPTAARPPVPAAQAPVPLVAPVPVPLAAQAPVPPPAPAAPAPVPAGVQPLPTASAAEVSQKKHATRRHKVPKIDQHGIGIPTD